LALAELGDEGTIEARCGRGDRFVELAVGQHPLVTASCKIECSLFEGCHPSLTQAGVPPLEVEALDVPAHEMCFSTEQWELRTLLRDRDERERQLARNQSVVAGR
jgi:hypothetical protein